jgi:hypothetical protein
VRESKARWVVGEQQGPSQAIEAVLRAANIGESVLDVTKTTEVRRQGSHAGSAKTSRMVKCLRRYTMDEDWAQQKILAYVKASDDICEFWICCTGVDIARIDVISIPKNCRVGPKQTHRISSHPGTEISFICPG